MIETQKEHYSKSNSSKSDASYDSSDNSDSSDDKKPPKKKKTEDFGSVPSYFMQQQLDVQTNFAQSMFETVRKGDIEAVKRIERRIGLDV